jgi:hypothetical protein
LDESNYSATNCQSYPGTTIFWLRLQELEFTCFRESRLRKKKKWEIKNIIHLDCHHYLITKPFLNSLGVVWLLVELGQQIKHGSNKLAPTFVP